MVSPAACTAQMASCLHLTARTHLHQQLVSRDPLHRLDHQVGQSLLLLVLPHALLQNTGGGQGWPH